MRASPTTTPTTITTPSPKRHRVRAIIVPILAFVLGIMIGAAMHSTPTAAPPPSPTVAAAAPASALSPALAPAPAPAAGPLTTFADGIYEIGTKPDQIAPGKYHAVGTGNGYYARLRSTSGEMSAIIANDVITTGPVTVTIPPTDVAFQSNGLTWTKIG